MQARQLFLLLQEMNGLAGMTPASAQAEPMGRHVGLGCHDLFAVQACMHDNVLHAQIRRVELSRTAASGAVASSLILQLLLECELEGVTRLRCAEGMLPDWDSKLFSRLEGLRILNLSSCQLSSLPAGSSYKALSPTTAYTSLAQPQPGKCMPHLLHVSPGPICMHAVLDLDRQGRRSKASSRALRKCFFCLPCRHRGAGKSAGAAGVGQQAVQPVGGGGQPAQAAPPHRGWQPSYLHPR